jgi:hypothetical protein
MAQRFPLHGSICSCVTCTEDRQTPVAPSRESILLQAMLDELKMLHRVLCSGCPHCHPVKMTDSDLAKELTSVLGVGPENAYNKE